MTKSNMKSVGIRRHHHRIQHQARVDDRVQQEKVYKQREHVPKVTEKITLSVANLCGKVSRFVNRLLKMPTITLNLTKKDPWLSNDRARDAGAWYLRDIWPELGTMVSTRDGRIIR